ENRRRVPPFVAQPVEVVHLSGVALVEPRGEPAEPVGVARRGNPGQRETAEVGLVFETGFDRVHQPQFSRESESAATSTPRRARSRGLRLAAKRQSIRTLAPKCFCSALMK